MSIVANVQRVDRIARRQAGLVVRSIGNGVECPFCGWTGRRFEPGGVPPVPNRVCRGCRSIERYRMLLLYLWTQPQLLVPGTRVLQTAPTACLTGYLRTVPGLVHTPIDLDPALVVAAATDLTALGLRSASIDVTISFHVLEHITDDRRAMAEMHRTLKPGGVLLAQVPTRGSVTDEDSAADADERVARFGQADHVRMYGADFADRLQEAGFDLDVRRTSDWCDAATVTRRGLRADELLWVARRRS